MDYDEKTIEQGNLRIFNEIALDSIPEEYLFDLSKVAAVKREYSSEYWDVAAKLLKEELAEVEANCE